MRTQFLCLAAAFSLWPSVVAAQSSLAIRRLPDEPQTQIEPSSTTVQPKQQAVELLNAPLLTLEELEAMALGNSPMLRQASARVEVARGRWTQVGLRPNPVIGYQGNEIGNEGEAGQQGGFVGQEFVTAGKLRLNRAAAAQEIAQAEQQLAAERFRVLNDVRIGFYSVLVAQRSLELSTELLRIAERAVQTSELLFKGKEVGKGDVLQSRIEAASASIAVANARNRYEAAWRRLAAAVAIPTMQPVQLAGDLRSGWRNLNWDEEMARLLTASPELAEARANAERAAWALRRARVEPVPNIDVQAGAAYDNASRDTIANVQIGIPIPVFNRNQGGIYAAQSELAAAQAQIRSVELDLQNRLALAFERYSNARQQVDRYARDILPNAKESLDLVTLAYSQGQGELPFLVLLTAQRTFFQTNLAYLDALRELWESQIAIEGMLLVRDSDSRQPARRTAQYLDRSNLNQ
jgi:cobalt-zinc-cadmium efflux system outer membrane protein